MGLRRSLKITFFDLHRGVVAAVGYAAQNVFPPCENPDRPSLMPEVEAEGMGACNSTKVKAVQLCEVPMLPIYSSSAMQKLAEPDDFP